MFGWMGGGVWLCEVGGWEWVLGEWGVCGGGVLLCCVCVCCGCCVCVGGVCVVCVCVCVCVVSDTHLRADEGVIDLVCGMRLEKKNIHQLRDSESEILAVRVYVHHQQHASAIVDHVVHSL